MTDNSRATVWANIYCDMIVSERTKAMPFVRLIRITNTNSVP